MKYKVLLTGKHNTVIDDFYTQMGEVFECLTTSDRFEDILNHLKYFQPDILVYCPNHESRDTINRMVSIKTRLEKDDISLIIVSSEEDYNEISQYTFNFEDMVLIKPITALSIMGKITEYLKEKQRLREEAIRAEEERIAQEKAAAKRHVLVIDDDPLMLKLIKEHLREKYEVATAPSGKIALKFLEKKKTDLILLDYAMPEEDGPVILEKIHANDAIKDIPVIFLTGITEREKIQKALVQNPQGYLLKPIDRDQLFETIERFIG